MNWMGKILAIIFGYCLGLDGVYLFFKGMKSGRISYRLGTYERDDEPSSFWLVIALSMIIGLTLLLSVTFIIIDELQLWNYEIYIYNDKVIYFQQISPADGLQPPLTSVVRY